MKADDQHIDFFKNLETPQQKSKEDLWKNIEDSMQERTPRAIPFARITWSIAALILVLLSTGIFMKMYVIEIDSKNGIALRHELPDGSIVELNSASHISYHPYWWQIERSISLSGEAFFEVEKGKNFKIISENGLTEVLGTSFNIYARDYDYEVFCLTGKVRVSSTKNDINFIIEANEVAKIDNNKQEGFKALANANEFMAWKEPYFKFDNQNLAEVFKSIERQYQVDINLTNEDIDSLTFSAYFEKPNSANEAIKLVCQTFNLTFEQVNQNYYQVYKQSIENDIKP